MRYLLGLLSIIVLLLGDPTSLLQKGFAGMSVGAAPPFDEVARTSHNLLAAREKMELSDVCLSCHTDGQLLREDNAGFPDSAQGMKSELKVIGGSMVQNVSGPLWSPDTERRSFSLVSSVWSLKDTLDRKPFGSSSACLGCHDGALAEDVHGEKKGLKVTDNLSERPVDHPTSIPYPRRYDGLFVIDQPTPTSLRYWSIADRTQQGVSMPSGPVSTYFRPPAGLDPKDPLVGASVVRTSYGMIHCDSCHNPHVNQHPPFLRTPPEDLCFVCHDR
jgi:predicted CXXCH cytochrome family protein